MTRSFYHNPTAPEALNVAEALAADDVACLGASPGCLQPPLPVGVWHTRVHLPAGERLARQSTSEARAVCANTTTTTTGGRTWGSAAGAWSCGWMGGGLGGSVGGMGDRRAGGMTMSLLSSEVPVCAARNCSIMRLGGRVGVPLRPQAEHLTRMAIRASKHACQPPGCAWPGPCPLSSWPSTVHQPLTRAYRPLGLPRRLGSSRGGS